MTVRAVVVLLDNEPAGMIGLALGVDSALLFSRCEQKLRPHLKRITVLRAIKLAMSMVRSCTRPVYAEREEGDILPRLGFEHVHGEVYRWVA